MNIERRRKLADASRMVYYPAEPQSKSISLPIYMSANFEYDSDSYRRVLDGDRRGVNIYSRCGNPSEYAFDSNFCCHCLSSEVQAHHSLWNTASKNNIY